MTFRIELFDHGWGGYRNDDTASRGHEDLEVARNLAEAEVLRWPHKELRIIHEETGAVVALISSHTGFRR
jgi:hypothetical protein